MAVYPQRDGKYVINRSLLPRPLAIVLDKIEGLDQTARQLRGEDESRAAVYERYRDAQVGLLWGADPPPAGVTFAQIAIIEE